MRAFFILFLGLSLPAMAGKNCSEQTKSHKGHGPESCPIESLELPLMEID